MSKFENRGRTPDLLLKIVDEQDIEAALKIVRDSCRYNHAIYHLAFRTNAPADMPFFRSTYPMTWLGHYVQHQYSDIDPCIQDGFKRNEPFFWSELKVKTDAQRALFQDAFKHGVGCSGFSIPLTDRSRRKAIFTVTSDLEENEWREKIAQELDILAKIGDLLHRKAVLEVYGTEDGTPLAPREIECLYWTANGKDGRTIAVILNISEHTVRDYLKSARLKLGCNTMAQAIHEATKRRIINQ